MFFGIRLFSVAGWLWLLFWVVWLVWGMITTRQRPVTKGRGGDFTVRLLVTVVVVTYIGHHFPAFFQYKASWPNYPPMVVTGFLLELAGMFLAVWARRHIGTFWSSAVVLREGHRVVDTGPYRLVRHPIYSGILLALLGTFLMEGSMEFLIILVVVVGVFVWKGWAEERLLIANLGEEYVNYRRRTHMLIPWLL